MKTILPLKPETFLPYLDFQLCREKIVMPFFLSAYYFELLLVRRFFLLKKISDRILFLSKQNTK